MVKHAGENASPRAASPMGLAVLKQVLALRERAPLGSTYPAVSRARMWLRCGTARGEALGGHARGDETSREKPLAGQAASGCADRIAGCG
jgi:hypothetical protein